MSMPDPLNVRPADVPFEEEPLNVRPEDEPEEEETPPPPR